MPLIPGARLGPYRIDAEIGAGGMGHVFRATDTRLDRAVAIKVLPQHRWSDPETRLRFEREARALSSVSHPNLCALYDVGELTQSDASTPYLVMELLEGETLRDRLDTTRMGARKALQWAAQIASGLAAAHAKGVIHRDLKPENVFITGGELLKILDFGLATTPPASDSATLLRTDPGTVLGTAHYMSPEQVRGKPLDARSDIFSLGTVLYEMLTGHVPFDAPSAVETMSAIIVDEAPELTNVPESVASIVHRCLEKDPAQRFASARDLAFALDNAAKGVTTSQASPVQRRAEKVWMQPRLLLLAILALGLIAVGILARRPDPPEPPQLRVLTYSGRDTSPAAAPDGKIVAYVSSRDGVRRIWIKQLADGTEAPVTTGPDDSAPRFAPDGATILFTRTSGRSSALYSVPVVGGDARKLIENAFDGDWSPDGNQIAFVRNRAAAGRLSTVCVAAAKGGAVRELASSKDDELSSPRWSPDGSQIATTIRPRGTHPGSIMLIGIASGERRVHQRAEAHGPVSGVAWSRDGKGVVYVELESIEGVGLPRRRGSCVLVYHDVRNGRARVLLRSPHCAADTVDLVGDRSVIFTEDVTRQNLQEVALDGAGPPRWLSRGMSVDRQPAYAREGRSVVFASDRSGNSDLWELMLDSGRVRRITDHHSVDWDPHPAGTLLYWSSSRGGHFEIWTATLDGASPQQVTRDGIDAENPSLPANGEWIYYDSSNPKIDGLWRIAQGGGAAELVVAGETVHPAVSADGAFVVYQRPEVGGSSGVAVVRVTDRRVFHLVTGIASVNATRAQWIGGTHTIAFRARDDSGRMTLYAQPFEPDVDTSALRRELLRADPDAAAESFAISPDGRRAVLSVIDEASGLMIAEGVLEP
jgi:Tol biopolymer transport system component/tRNA A-37 threonylcarbamoyl transferase component Bud32